MISDFPNR